MKRYLRAKFLAPLFASLAFLAACVTINIYFPAEKVESVAGEIVKDIRGPNAEKEKPPAPNKKDSRLNGSFFAFSVSRAWADEVTTVSNPTIRALKQRMRARFEQMRPYYKKGLLIEGNDGYLSLGNTGGVDLKTLRDLKSLVAAENTDRKALYGEVARALKIDPSQIDRVAAIFAKEWQRYMP